MSLESLNQYQKEYKVLEEQLLRERKLVSEQIRGYANFMAKQPDSFLKTDERINQHLGKGSSKRSFCFWKKK